MQQDTLMDREQAAEYIGVKPRHLQIWAIRKYKETHDTPVYYRLGRNVRYKRSDLDAWLERQRVQ